MLDSAPIRDIDVHPKIEPIVLVILDGWGISAGVSGNAIRQATPVNFIRLWHEHPHGVLRAVSAIDDAAGNAGSSAVGHASIGTGRLLHSDASEITLALRSGDFFRAPGFAKLVATVQSNRTTLHLIGLMSDTSSHGRVEHLIGSAELAHQQGLTDVVIHLILDNEEPARASRSLANLHALLTTKKLGRIGTVIGRLFAMDRGGERKKTRAAYQALIGRAPAQRTIDDVVNLVGQVGYQPADLVPTTIVERGGGPVGPVRAGDTILVTQTRADRISQLVAALGDPTALTWLGLIRQEPFLGPKIWTLIDYRLGLPAVQPIFKTAEIPDSLSRILSVHGLAQLKISVAERADHLGLYLNGGQRDPFDREGRWLANYQAPKNPTTDPDYGTSAVNRLALNAITRRSAPFIVVNLAAADCLAHTSDFDATVKAVAAVDRALGSIGQATLAAGGALIVTADHGNAESLLPSRGAHHHTASGVPWIVATAANRRATNVAPGRLAFPAGLPDHQHSLADIAPTILGLLGIAKPSTMGGKSLLHPPRRDSVEYLV